MSKEKLYRYDSEDLKYILDECYFHPSRDREYPCKRFKYKARRAMKELWYADSITFLGETFGQDETRRIMVEEMMPEHLDSALNFFRRSPRLKTTRQLAELLLLCTVHSDTAVALMGEHDFPQFSKRGSDGAV